MTAQPYRYVEIARGLRKEWKLDIGKCEGSGAKSEQQQAILRDSLFPGSGGKHDGLSLADETVTAKEQCVKHEWDDKFPTYRDVDLRLFFRGGTLPPGLLLVSAWLLLLVGRTGDGASSHLTRLVAVVAVVTLVLAGGPFCI